ncbi:MAG: hypothetical protein KJN97_13795 [Deltaproteobacteria bacterium]|nr:hypothetical protein [Deltaproteobacteria bacterium]
MTTTVSNVTGEVTLFALRSGEGLEIDEIDCEALACLLLSCALEVLRIMDNECNEEVCKQPSCAPGPRTTTVDRAAAGLALIWLGIVWVAGIAVGIGLLGVAVIVLVDQLLRVRRGLKAKSFGLGLGVAFAAVGGLSLGGASLPPAPFLLILGGAALLLSLLVRGGLLESGQAGQD